jgi:hypothetical protein
MNSISFLCPKRSLSWGVNGIGLPLRSNSTKCRTGEALGDGKVPGQRARCQASFPRRYEGRVAPKYHLPEGVDA